MADPSLLGWITVAAYFGTAFLCEHIWWNSRQANRPRQSNSSMFWLIMTVLFTVLGAAKQLNLQALLTGTLRDVAKAQDWYADRRWVQFAFIVLVGVLAFLAAATFAWLGARAWKQDVKRNFPTLASTLLLLGFLVIRAASLHYVDAVLYATVGGIRWNAIIELSVVALVAMGTAWAIQDNKREVASVKVNAPVDDSSGLRRYSLPGIAPSSRSRDRQP